MKCIVVDDEPLAHRIIKNYCEHISFLSLEKECHSAFEAIEYLNENQVDLIFLDINMPQLKGLDFLRTLSNPPFIIITSAYQEYALEGYELNISDYLLKPFSFERFLKAVNKVNTQQKLITSTNKEKIVSKEVKVEKTENQERIFVKGDKKIHQINFNSILYLESIGSYVKIHLDNEKIITLDRLSNFEKRLPKNLFIRIHRSYIIAVNKIEVIEGNRVKVSDYKIPIGNVYKQHFLKIIK